ncbi:hypothetical protein [Arthrobacter sp. S2(2024)]|uniref:hypothetical protein n=1 Tax=Arthrobacter sp. S2(2024) TaxID=3111911 RepID=UPI002FC83862
MQSKPQNPIHIIIQAIGEGIRNETLVRTAPLASGIIVGDNGIHITVQSPCDVPEMLTWAENQLRPVAVSAASGILVTRHGPASYSLSVDHTVPVGETLERSL